MICSNCGSDEFETDNTRGTICCGQCGMLQEENLIVNTIQFNSEGSKPSMYGQIISVDNSNVGTQFIDSSYYIKNTIKNICMKLSLGQEHVECAFRWYKICLTHSMTKGKSILYTLSACVYISCRQESTPHLLIDFSNELRIDMFQIGKVFLKLRGLLGLEIPLIDPSLYMHRFVSQLKFKSGEILSLAMRLISRMKKDWILVGRRPNNSCGAALLLASRICGEPREIHEIAKVVHASVFTINRRLKEIAETESGNLEIDDFNKIWIETESLPPISKQQMRDVHSYKEMYFSDSVEMNSVYSTPQSQSTSKADKKADLSDSSEFSLEHFVLDEAEVQNKSAMWESMYGEYLREMEAKRAKKPKTTAIRTRKKRHNFDTIEEAFQSLDKKVTSKLNYRAIDSLFED